MIFFRLALSLFLVLFLFYGCSSKKRIISLQKELPIWYQNPMQTTSATLYTVAEGESKSDAIANALSEILSSLSISISSDFHTKTLVKEGYFESIQTTSSSDIRTQVQKIRINNYEVIHSDNFSFKRYLVAIKIDKKSLSQGLHQDLDTKFKLAQNKMAKNYHAIKELSVYKNSIKSLDDIHATLALLHSLNPKFNDTTYIQKLQKIQNKYDVLLSKISFSIHSNTDAKNLKSSLRKALSSKKYKIKNAKDKNHFSIYINSKTLIASSYGFNLARVAISITVKDYKGVIVGSNKLHITGQSTQGNKIAKENVAVKLNTLIHKEGISKIIGLDI